MPRQDVTTTWDISTMTHSPSGPTKLYMLLLLIACIAAGVKLIEGWRRAARFRKSTQPAQPEYFQFLISHIISLKRWIQLAILAWGICLCLNVGDNLTYLRSSISELHHPVILLSMLSDYLTFTTMAMFTITFIYLVRWYLSTRLERAR
jgi:hypothetical protein